MLPQYKVQNENNLVIVKVFSSLAPENYVQDSIMLPSHPIVSEHFKQECDCAQNDSFILMSSYLMLSTLSLISLQL